MYRLSVLILILPNYENDLPYVSTLVLKKRFSKSSLKDLRL